MPDPTSDAAALGAAHYEAVITARDFLRENVRPIVKRVAKDDHYDGTIHGLFLRGDVWLSTFAELKGPQHFQAAIAGTRTLLEICIDVALLHHERARFTPAMMLAWERSAKLASAERTQRCFANRTLPIEYTERINFIARERSSILAERDRFWPRKVRPGAAPTTKPPSHPGRWTGRSLDEDATTADGHGDYGLRDYYDGRFAELCWSTHGSSLAGVRSISEDTFPGLIASAFQDAANLGTLLAALTLRYFDKLDDPIVEARFRRLAKDREYWSARGWAKAKGYTK